MCHLCEPELSFFQWMNLKGRIPMVLLRPYGLRTKFKHLSKPSVYQSNSKLALALYGWLHAWNNNECKTLDVTTLDPLTKTTIYGTSMKCKSWHLLQ